MRCILINKIKRKIMSERITLYLLNCTLQLVEVSLNEGEMGEKELLKRSVLLFLLRQRENDTDCNLLAPDHLWVGSVALICHHKCLFSRPCNKVHIQQKQQQHFFIETWTWKYSFLHQWTRHDNQKWFRTRQTRILIPNKSSKLLEPM